MTEESPQESKNRSARSLGVWLAIGIGIGVAIGAGFGNPAFGAGIGVPIGVAFWFGQKRQRGKEQNNDPQAPDEIRKRSEERMKRG